MTSLCWFIIVSVMEGDFLMNSEGSSPLCALPQQSVSHSTIGCRDWLPGVCCFYYKNTASLLCNQRQYPRQQTGRGTPILKSVEVLADVMDDVHCNYDVMDPIFLLFGSNSIAYSDYSFIH